MDPKIEFLNRVDEINGFYLDASNACREFVRNMEEGRAASSQRTGIPIDEMDKLPFAYTENSETMDAMIFDHVTTQGEVRERNKRGGKNYKILSALCIVQIYDLWENYFREAIAKEKGVNKNDIEVDIMGDLAQLRHSILKHRGLAVEGVKRCKIINWFNENDPIIIDESRFRTIIHSIKNGIGKL